MATFSAARLSFILLSPYLNIAFASSRGSSGIGRCSGFGFSAGFVGIGLHYQSTTGLLQTLQ